MNILPTLPENYGYIHLRMGDNILNNFNFGINYIL